MEMPERMTFDICVKTSAGKIPLQKIEYIRADYVADMIKAAVKDNNITFTVEEYSYREEKNNADTSCEAE